MFNDVTMVITSCGRLDLLDRTIKSIPASVLGSIPHKIIVDDSGNPDVHTNLLKYKDFDLILNSVNIGQPKSVDIAYSKVNTEYIFHCEDDWDFGGDETFLSEAYLLLSNAPNEVFQTTFRVNDPHPVYHLVGYYLKVPKWNGIWYGFTYNPSLIRKSAYNQVAPYSGNLEQDISKKYFEANMYSAHMRGVVRHIGDGRSTNPYLKL